MAGLEGIDLKDLDASFGGFPAGDATPNKSASDKDKAYYESILNHDPVKSVLKKDGVDIDDLDSSFGQSSYKRVPMYDTKSSDKPAATSSDSVNNAISSTAKGVLQGIKDIPNSGAQLIGYLDQKASEYLPSVVGEGGIDRNADLQRRLAEEEAYNPKDNSSFDVGRIGGQVAATGPLATAIPEFAAVKAVPYVGKLLSSVARGVTGGGIFGAATNSSNDEGIVSNVGTNALYGGAAGPFVEGGAKVANKVVSKLKDVVEAVRINNIVKNSGIDPNAARNTLARLQEAGYTPMQAAQELQRLGPSATLGDISPSLTTEVGGLAHKGGAATDLIEGRYRARADNANTVAHDIMESRLGVKPDFEAEKAAAKAERQSKTKADYDAAKASNMALDVQPVIDKIDDGLKNAVGSEAAELQNARSYLHDSKGNVKADTAPLLKARQGLDDRLDKLKKEGTSQASATYRAVAEVRDELDKVLKTNPDLAIADAKYAKLAQDFGGLDIGRKSMANNFENFEREFNAASPEKQEYMRKGLRIQIGDLMEKATRGELSEAQRLFGKSTSNRKIIRLAFGRDGDEVLDALANQAQLKATEQAAYQNSRTARNLAVGKRPEYGGDIHNESIIAPVVQGAMADVVTGTPGAATAIGAGKGVISGLRAAVNREKIENTVKGTADLLSRQQSHGRDTAIDILDRVHRVSRNRTARAANYNSSGSIAIRAASPAAIPSVKRLKALVDDFRGG